MQTWLGAVVFDEVSKTDWFKRGDIDYKDGKL